MPHQLTGLHVEIQTLGIGWSDTEMGCDVGRHSSGSDSVTADPFRPVKSGRALRQPDQAVLADSVCGACQELMSRSASKDTSQRSLTTSPPFESSE